MFWRLPSFDGKIDAFIDGMSKEQLKFTIVDKEGNDAPEEVYNKYLHDEDFRKAYRSSLGIINYRPIKKEEMENWKFYFAPETSFHVTGDNPIIKKDEFSKHPQDTDFIIPLSGKNLLVHSRTKSVEELAPSIIMKIHLLILLQSSKYACSANRPYLKSLNQFKKSITARDIEQLRNDVFAAI